MYALEAEIADLRAYVGYTDGDIYGVEVDFATRSSPALPVLWAWLVVSRSTRFVQWVAENAAI